MSFPSPRGFPVSLDLDGRPCLVVGAGRIAVRKTEQLLRCGATVTVMAPEVDSAFGDLPVRVEQRRYSAGDVDGFWLVITATADTAVDQQIFDECEARHIWCNSADDPQRCSFILPAVHRQGPISVAISTGGVSPALASWLRGNLSAVLGPEFAELAARLADERAAVHAEGRSTEDVDWRPIIERLAAEVGAHAPGSVPA
jgi:precorrin-2 dehydrogenase / sirohydrochlorin ferrochelatase